MSAPWIAAFGVLWAVVLLVAFTLVGVLRRVTSVLERLERTGAAERLGAPVLSTVETFDLSTREGESVPWRSFVREPTILLFVSPACEPCDELVSQLGAVGPRVEGVPLIVVAPEGASMPLPSGLSVLYERAGAATLAFGNRASPQAYAVDESGLVLDRRLPGSAVDVRQMARFQRSGGPAGAPAKER